MLVDEGKWSGNDTGLVKTLNFMTEMREPPLYDPDPDYTIAKEITDLLGGEIISYDEMSALPEGAVW